MPHREVVWVIFGQISSGCLLLLLPLWACGQRTCVVHHVHSDVGRAAYSIRGSVTSPCPALGPTVGRDAIPMTIDHCGELLIRLEPLPLEARAPVLEETPRPALALVAPQLAEALLEDVGGVEPLVGRQQRL